MLHRRARLAFWCYAVLLFTLTHWPKLAIPIGPIPRPDLLQHLVAFGGWAVVFTACGFFGRWNSARNLLLSWLIGVAYACTDESLQAIPYVNRIFGWDDMLFNVIGITSGIAFMTVVGKVLANRQVGADSIIKEH